MRKSKFIKLEKESNDWLKINGHLYSGSNSKNLFIGAYEYKNHFIIFDYYFDEVRNKLIKHISISNKNKTPILNDGISINRIIKNFIGDNYVIDGQIQTNRVLNVFEKV